MRIDGAGGCFDNRIYEINNKSAWNLLLLTCKVQSMKWV